MIMVIEQRIGAARGDYHLARAISINVLRPGADGEDIVLQIFGGLPSGRQPKV